MPSAASSSTTSTTTPAPTSLAFERLSCSAGFTGPSPTGSSTKNDAPAPGATRTRDAAAVLLHDRVGDRQPEARALADLLRREERIEDLRLHLFRNPGPIVVDLEDDRVAVRVVPGAHDQHAAAVRGEHRLLGVDDQIEQHLLELMRIGEHLRQAGGERVDDGDVAEALLVRAQRQRLAHDLIDVDHRARRLALAREGQQVADDLARRAPTR